MEVHATLGLTGQHAGAIWIYLGPMFSGKTTAMGNCITRAAHAKKNGVIIKYAHDTRYTVDASIRTHAGVKLACNEDGDLLCIRVVAAERLAEVKLDPKELVIGVDEGQFYPDLVKVCEQWAQEGRWVVVAALDGSWRRAPIGDTLALIPFAERVEKLQAVCTECGDRAAPFTWRFISPAVGAGPTESVADVYIGGAETYRAVCRDCYYSSERLSA